MRFINEIIVHCTATREGHDVSVEDIRKWHLDRGWSDIGYHYVVLLNGTVAKGRPVEKVGAHVAGRNKNTIGVVYVGGLNKFGSPKDTRTSEQKNGLLKTLEQLISDYPKVSNISGHNQYANKACPCFNVGQEYDGLIVRVRNGEVGGGDVVEAGDIVSVTASTLNVREKPIGKKLRKLSLGDKVTVIDRQGDWLHLSPQDGGGWIHGDYVTEIDNN
jgi:N-acetylmuramoyl-L-alanine amidase